MVNRLTARWLLLSMAWAITLPTHSYEVGARLPGTGGVASVEGAAGGGIVPWAVISSYGQQNEWGASAYATYIDLDDYRFASAGWSVGISNRIEFSYSLQQLDLQTLDEELGLPDETLDQEIFGAKLRLFNYLIYSDWPQVTVGIQHKRNLDFDIPQLVGAVNEEDTEFYVAASKLWLSGVGGRPLLWNGTVRSTRANQLGLLGFGGPLNDDREWQFETSAALLLGRDIVAGVEYRQKPDNIAFAEEEDWADVFVAWFPNKHWSITAAWTQLGSIAGKDDQSGFYLSIQGTL